MLKRPVPRVWFKAPFLAALGSKWWIYCIIMPSLRQLWLTQLRYYGINFNNKESDAYIRTRSSTLSPNAKIYAMFVDTAAGGEGKWYSYTPKFRSNLHDWHLALRIGPTEKEFRDCIVALMWDVVIRGTIRDYPGKYSLHEYLYVIPYVITEVTLENRYGSFQSFVFSYPLGLPTAWTE